jgi:hypothetical protein
VGGRFCAACGEEWTEGRDYSLRRFAHESVASLTDLDSSLLRTLRTLLGSPGTLTADYFAGRRRHWLSPLKVFFVCNVVFFFVQSATHSTILSSTLAVYRRYQPFRSWARPLVDHRIAERGISLREYATAFDAMAVSQAKTLVIVMAPLLALVVAIVFARRRRYFVEHLVFAIHFYAWFLLIVPAIQGLLGLLFVGLYAAAGISESVVTDASIGLVMLAVCTAYLTPAARRFYGTGPWASAVASLVIAASVVVVLQAYRWMLFYTVFLLT